MTVQWVESPTAGVSYPAAPWHMVGQLWLTLFKVSERVDDLRPAGIYGAAFVSLRGGQPADLQRAARRPAGLDATRTAAG